MSETSRRLGKGVRVAVGLGWKGGEVERCGVSRRGVNPNPTTHCYLGILVLSVEELHEPLLHCFSCRGNGRRVGKPDDCHAGYLTSFPGLSRCGTSTLALRRWRLQFKAVGACGRFVSGWCGG
ncbi:hypothetical protein M3J09_008226 [Ascochyta lentis]